MVIIINPRLIGSASHSRFNEDTPERTPATKILKPHGESDLSIRLLLLLRN